MSRLGVIEATEPNICDLCGKTSELRPCGPRGENVCYWCAMKDEKAMGFPSFPPLKKMKPKEKSNVPN